MRVCEGEGRGEGQTEGSEGRREQSEGKEGTKKLI